MVQPCPTLPNGLTYLSFPLPPWLLISSWGWGRGAQGQGLWCSSHSMEVVCGELHLLSPLTCPHLPCVCRHGASGLQSGVSGAAWGEWLAQVGTALDPR